MSYFSNYEKIEATYQELHKLKIPKDKKVKLDVSYNNKLFEFLLFFRSESEKVIVMGSGAFNSEKMKPPIFNRHKWIDVIEESTILYNDPTLYLGDINIGWGYGTKDRHFIKEIGDILKKLYANNGFKTSSALYFGSSAGGFTALMLASYLRGRAFVNNPQTDIEKYFATFVARLKEVVLGSKNGTLDKKRSNVVEWFKHNNFVPKIHYAQNLACEHDVERHFLPFVDQVQYLDSSCFSGKIVTYLYSNKEQGHNPLETKETLNIIKSIFKQIR